MFLQRGGCLVAECLNFHLALLQLSPANTFLNEFFDIYKKTSERRMIAFLPCPLSASSLSSQLSGLNSLESNTFIFGSGIAGDFLVWRELSNDIKQKHHLYK